MHKFASTCWTHRLACTGLQALAAHTGLHALPAHTQAYEHRLASACCTHRLACTGLQALNAHCTLLDLLKRTGAEALPLEGVWRAQAWASAGFRCLSSSMFVCACPCADVCICVRVCLYMHARVHAYVCMRRLAHALRAAAQTRAHTSVPHVHATHAWKRCMHVCKPAQAHVLPAPVLIAWHIRRHTLPGTSAEPPCHSKTETLLVRGEALHRGEQLLGRTRACIGRGQVLGRGQALCVAGAKAAEASFDSRGRQRRRSAAARRIGWRGRVLTKGLQGSPQAHTPGRGFTAQRGRGRRRHSNAS